MVKTCVKLVKNVAKVIYANLVNFEVYFIFNRTIAFIGGLPSWYFSVLVVGMALRSEKRFLKSMSFQIKD